MVDSARKRRQFGCSTATAAAASGGPPRPRPPPPSTTPLPPPSSSREDEEEEEEKEEKESAMRKMESNWRRGIVRRRGSIVGMGGPIIVDLSIVIIFYVCFGLEEREKWIPTSKRKRLVALLNVRK